jgi:hypothetical protein
MKVAADRPQSEHSISKSIDSEKIQEIWEPIKDWPSFINEKMPEKYQEWMQPGQLNFGSQQQDDDPSRPIRFPDYSQNGSYQNIIDLRNSNKSINK